MAEFEEDFVLSIARDAYAHGDAAFEVEPDSCVLLVIDMQDEFVRPHWSPFWVPEATRIVGKVQKLIRRCRQMNIPVIYTVMSKTHHRFDRPMSGAFMPNRYAQLKVDMSHYFVEGRVWHELSPEDTDVVIHKPSYGAFYDTPLESILKNLRRNTVIICGTLTNYCCGTTARQAYERGLRVVFGSDITATDDPDMQEPELRTLRKGFAKVMTLDAIMAVLS